MRALRFDGHLRYQPDASLPVLPPGEALIRTQLAGICNTDVEIVRGYKGFIGILGHEFVGVVERADSAPHLVGRRVVGEINAYCGQCPTCRRGQPTQCPNRTTLGIDRRNGAMADYFTLPVNLIYPLADSLPNEWAVFTEPLAAACQILEQVQVKPTDRVVVLGDGKLGLLIAQVLQLTGCNLLVLGKHPGKLDILRRRGIAAQLISDPVADRADVVIEVTGSSAGIVAACQVVRPRGTVVLKSTFHGETRFDLSKLVVDEVTVVGSRCGPFPAALRLLEQRLVDVEPLIHATYSLSDGLAAFEQAVAPGVLKVLLSMA